MADNKRILIFIFLGMIISACSLQGGAQDAQIIPEEVGQVVDDKKDYLAVFSENLIEEYQPILESMENATRYQIDLQIADTLTDIGGHQEVYYVNNEELPLGDIYFRLFPNTSGAHMTISNLTVNGDPVPVITAFQNSAVRVNLPQPLQPGDVALISMDFQQTVPSAMGGNYGLYSYIDGILALDQFLPIIPVYDDEGWNVEDPPHNADMAYNDAAFFEVTVDAPAGLALAGSGVEISAGKSGDRRQVTFIGGPQRDFYLAAGADLQCVTAKVGDTTVNSYFLEEYRDSGEMVLETARHALESYGQRFGTYPYTELDLISTPMSAGGMEYSGATALSISYFDPDFMVNALIYLESITAHEVAHQWFFNQVMSDQIDEPWLDEALVQYATYLYYVDRYGEGNAQGYVNSWYDRWSRVEMAEIPIGKPAAEYTQEEYSPIVYGRGPLFFAALEEEIGQETFDRLLRAYADEYRWGIADTEDFRELAEETCGCDLTDLFEAWVYD